MTRYAITGATGFVGSHVLDRLPRDCACLVRDPAAAARLEAEGRRVVRGGLDDRAALDTLVAGADIVLHVAGAIAARSEDAYFAVNREGTAHVAEACRRAGVQRLVHVSTIAVTGPASPGHPVDERTPPRPVTAYGRSKQAGEDVVRASGVPFTIIRPPVVYGPRDRQVLRLFRMARGPVVPLLGDGSQELTLVQVADLADALLAAAASAQTLGGTYHAAHPEVVTQRALVEKIRDAVGGRARLLPLPLPVVRAALGISGLYSRVTGRRTLLNRDKAPEFLAPAWTCATDALARDAGWRARIALDQGLPEAARWYAQAGWL